MRRILQICQKPAIVAVDGGTIASQVLSLGLIDSGCEVVVRSVETDRHPPRTAENPGFASDVSYDGRWVDTAVRPLQALRAIASEGSYNLTRFDAPAMHRLIRRTLQEAKFDAVILDGLFTASCLPTIRELTDAPVVLRAQNVEHRIWERRAVAAGGPKALYLRHLSERLRVAEVEIFRSVDAIAPISSIDLEVVRELAPDTPAELVEASVPVEGLHHRGSPEPGDIRMLAAFDWEPNVEGARWFIEHVWPLVRRVHPTAQLTVAGRASKELGFQGSGVTVLGAVESAEEFVSGAAMVVCPLLSGSGIRIKLIEAMLLGVPVIATPIGAEGIDEIDEFGLPRLGIGESPTQLAGAINSWVASPIAASEAAQRAMSYATERFDRRRAAARLLELIDAVSDPKLSEPEVQRAADIEPTGRSTTAVMIVSRDPRQKADHGRLSVLATCLRSLEANVDSVTVINIGPEVSSSESTVVAGRLSSRLTSMASRLLARKPINLALGLDSSQLDQIRQRLREDPPDLVVLDGLRSSLVLEAIPASSRILLDLDDLLSDRYSQWADIDFRSIPFDVVGTKDSPINRLVRSCVAVLPFILRYEARRLAPLERELANAVDAVSLVSRSEATTLASRSDRRVHVLPMTVESPAALWSQNSEKRFDAIFVGRVNYLTNMVGLAWFAERVLPKLETELGRPPVIAIAGSSSDTVDRWLRSIGLQPLGFVPDLDEVIVASSCAIAPQTTSGGLNTKVLDYGLRGIPIVATSKALSGLSTRIVETMTPFDDAASFSSAVAEAVAGRGVPPAAGSEVFQEHYGRASVEGAWGRVIRSTLS